jgi:hypothetical protein
MGDAAAFELEDEKSVVLAGGFVVMDHAGAPGHHPGDTVLLTEEVAGGGDAVAAEVVHGAAAGLFDVPKMGRMGAGVGFARADPEDAADGAGIDGLFGFDDAGGKDFGFGVTVEGAGGGGGLPHLEGLGAVAAKGFGADLVAAVLGELERDGEMGLVGKGDDEEIDVVTGDEGVEIGGGEGDIPAVRKRLGA